MAFKMKGFNPGKGTGMDKKLAAKGKLMAEVVTEKMTKKKDYIPQTKSRKGIESDIRPQTSTDKLHNIVRKGMKKRKSPMKKEAVDNTSYAKARREKARLKKEREDKRAKSTTFVDKTTAQYKKSSAMKKIDPPAKQAKIKKMIIAGIEKGKDDRDILSKINQMSDGNVEYTYNRKTKQVKVRKKGASGFEGELETDPDKG